VHLASRGFDIAFLSDAIFFAGHDAVDRQNKKEADSLRRKHFAMYYIALCLQRERLRRAEEDGQRKDAKLPPIKRSTKAKSYQFSPICSKSTVPAAVTFHERTIFNACKDTLDAVVPESDVFR
jgi:hypothetical protein